MYNCLTRISITCLLACGSIISLEAQGLDTSFGNNGIATTAIGTGSDRSFEVALTTDGKIIVGGQSHNGSDNDIAILRYHSDGSLDTTFGNKGVTITPVGDANDYCDGLVIQPDGKIVIAGFFDEGQVLVIRYNEDGSLDDSFGDGGIVRFDPSPGYDLARDVQLQADGKIVITGSASNGADQDILLARFNTDGTPDVSFDADGMLTIPVGNSNDAAFQLAVQADNKIVCGGYIITSDLSKNIVMVRCNPDGTLDNTFGEGGISLSAWSNITSTNFDAAYTLALQPDGKILLGGYAHGIFLEVDYYIAVARYDTTGQLDTSFGNRGVFKTIFGPVDQELSESVTDLTIQADGKILAAGQSSIIGFNGDFLMFRLNTNGTLDNSFGGNGFISTTISQDDDVAGAVVVQPDGKILLGGYAFLGAGDYDFAVARYGDDISGCSAVSNTAALNVGSTSATLRFKPLPGSRAKYRIRYRKQRAAGFTTIAVGRNATLPVNGLAANTTYEWQVQTLCGETSSYFTVANNFRTKRTALSAETGASAITGIEEGVHVFPNPVTTSLTVIIGGRKQSFCEISITDIKGSTVFTKTYPDIAGKNQLTIDVSNFVSGMYLVKLKTDEGVTVKKIIKQ